MTLDLLKVSKKTINFLARLKLVNWLSFLACLKSLSRHPRSIYLRSSHQYDTKSKQL